MSEKKPNCRFNSAIECKEETPQCQKCGWNPKVEKKRKKGKEKKVVGP